MQGQSYPDCQRRGFEQRVVALRFDAGDQVRYRRVVEIGTPPIKMVKQPEAVIFDQGDEQLTYEQVLSTIYDEGDEAK